ncbi:hypothetical protein BO70DRAFT_175983 [Aspergillus heteromorphus CBS 117.55]|uniref:HNH nuclease domain-containing protein n=1 Tax=Aspergillus heteromorphus CBS 117.55 TaxID=1448321 RepID=A0A317UWW5_9EURO|nr:uncharacterized protein BO70DRAFT_175983 [Aspergillus heteromorphus CBS 117.55]PWY66006.1 hypothetical protein BO70DRAFT_175983 [Aspergillus heteromorphus CBS 117.55]
MCSHFLRFETMRTRWALFAVDEHGTVGARVSQANAFVAPGHYAVRSRDGHPIAVRLTSERHVRRVRTPQTGSQSLRENQLHFRDAVRSRDRACAITGQRPGTLHDPWRGLMAAHIYPVSRLAAWNQERRAWITDTTDAAMIAPSGLFSAQNGLLLEATTHICFDLYEIAVSPDHGYRVVPFALDSLGVGGLVLSSTTRPARDENRRVSDDILRWHFHQAILRNMRGAGERPWDEDNAGGGRWLSLGRARMAGRGWRSRWPPGWGPSLRRESVGGMIDWPGKRE